MKLTGILTLLFVLALNTKSVSQTISFTGTNVSLEKVLQAIKKQTGFYIVTTQNEIRQANKVTINVKDMELGQFLLLIAKDQPFEFIVKGKSISIRKKSIPATLSPSLPNTGTVPITGIILGPDGTPLAGASITIKGRQVATVSDNSGKFSMDANIDDILTVSFVGFETKDLKITSSIVSAANPSIAISLDRNVSRLDTAVVIVNTGYQTISKERFIGSYAQLDSQAFHRRAGMDIISRLDGTVTGILFDKKSASSQLGSIQIRGVSTLTGLSQSAKSEPLIVVDNFPFKQDLSTINVNDIESVTVLKDAAAASIWGAQAGNGVIVITTRKGKYNRALSISASSNVSVREKPDLYYYPQMNIADFIDAEVFLFNKGQYDNDLNNTSTWPAISPVVEMLAKRRAGQISGLDSAEQINGFKSLDVRRDLDKYAYRNAVSQQHYLNISGGSNSFNFNLSGGYNRSLNNVQNSRPDDQFTCRSNIGFRPIKGLEINAAINYSQSTQRSAQLNLPGELYPYAQLVDDEGRFLPIPNNLRVGYIDTAGAGKLLDWRYNPLSEVKLADRYNVTRLVQLSTIISYRFLSWLSASVNYQINDQTSDGSNYAGINTYYTRNLVNQFTNLAQQNSNLRNPIPIGGILDQSNGESKSQNVRGQLTISKLFGQHHRLDALVASEVSETIFTGSSNRFYGYSKDNGSYASSIDYSTNFPIYGTAVFRKIINGNSIASFEKTKYASFLGNLSYAFDNKYYIYASARKDGANVFGVNTNRKWKPLWSVGGSWDILKENLLKIKWLSSFRLRGSYGYAGNPGNGTGLPTILYDRIPAGYTNLVSATPNDAPNPDLRWEKIRTINEGIDFSLLNNRISGSIDIFQKRTTDIISKTPFAPSTGVVSFITNTASLNTNGYEIKFRTKNVVGAFNWESSFGLSYARTVVTKLFTENGYAVRNFLDYGQNAIEGEIAFGIASYRSAGLDPLTGDPRGYVGKTISTNYEAISNDSISNQIFNGSSIPLYQGYLGNTFLWKNISLSLNITYRLDFYFRKPTITYSSLVDSWTGHSDYALRWKQPGDEKITTVPSFVYPLNTDRDKFYRFSEENVLRGDNVRIQDIRIDYQLTRPLHNMQIFVYTNDLNWILWRKNNSNLDPDFVGGVNFMAPTPKSVTAGITISL